MSAPGAPAARRTGRSVLAVAGGFLATAILSLAVDQALHAAGVYPPWGEPMSGGLFLLATLYRVFFTVLGGWLTAALSPGRPMRDAWILGVVGSAFALAGVAARLVGGPALGPLWYPLALVATAIPCVLGGAWLRVRGRSADAAAVA